MKRQSTSFFHAQLLATPGTRDPQPAPAVIRFAFEGRCRQKKADGTSAAVHQSTRALKIEPHGGEIVTEYFDAGQSSAVP